jgi:hypothetical protein
LPLASQIGDRVITNQTKVLRIFIQIVYNLNYTTQLMLIN